MKIRDLKEEHYHTHSKLENIEQSLPKTIREMIDYYTDQKLQPKFDDLVNKDQLRDQISLKLDYAVFNEYMKKQQSADATNDKEFRTDERLFLIEQSVRNLVPKDELKQQLKMKASNERFIELREGLHKLQVMSISN